MLMGNICKMLCALTSDWLARRRFRRSLANVQCRGLTPGWKARCLEVVERYQGGGMPFPTVDAKLYSHDSLAYRRHRRDERLPTLRDKLKRLWQFARKDLHLFSLRLPTENGNYNDSEYAD